MSVCGLVYVVYVVCQRVSVLSRARQHEFVLTRAHARASARECAPAHASA